MALTRTEIQDIMLEAIELRMKLKQAAEAFNAAVTTIRVQADAEVAQRRAAYEAAIAADVQRLKAINETVGVSI